MKKYLIRQESFGYTFFDKRKLKYQFLAKKDLGRLLKELKISEDEIDWLHSKRKDLRQDIIYSPIRIYYELTLACNLRCRYCFNSSGKPRKSELSTNEVLKSLDHLKECNVLDIRFTGGEPTCRHDWFSILKYAKELGFATSYNTNATYPDGSICEDLKRLDLASKYVSEINFFTIIFIGRGSHLESTDAVTVEDHLKMSQEIRRLKPKYPNLNILHFAEVSKRTSVSDQVHQKFGLKIGPPSGTTTFNIASDGSYCCGGYALYIDPASSMGNIKIDNLLDVWQKNSLLEKRRNDGRKLILFCNKCEKYIKGECQGSEYETELNRLINPGVKNPTCIYGNGPSLLRL